MSNLAIIHERMLLRLKNDGINFRLFYDNPSYFRQTVDGPPVLIGGSHPTIAHWPISSYSGGPALLEKLSKMVSQLEAACGSGPFEWVMPQYWHNTIFSPVHSSDPSTIELHNFSGLCDSVAAAADRIRSYRINFQRLLISTDGFVIALGEPVDEELWTLRRRLKERIPCGKHAELVQITLGRVTDTIAPNGVQRAIEFLENHWNDSEPLGYIDVHFISYCTYHGPITRMRLDDGERLFLRQSE